MKPRLLEIKQGVLDKNDLLARDLRRQFETAGVFALNVVSSPGSGKTTLLIETVKQLHERGYRIAVLVGDLETDNDAKRLEAAGAPVRQIVTAGTCHLEAHMITEHLGDWDLSAFDFLIIENVGNLVCPSSFDLGEALRVVLLSVTEGEDKPLKYPPMFNSSDVALITKIDIAEVVEFDEDLTRQSIESVHPGMEVIGVSAKKGQGMAAWMDFLVERHRAQVEAASTEQQV